MRNSRELTPEDRQRLDAELAKFRTEFECWRDMFANDWDILDFVRYEGIRVPIADQTAPLILGEKCVALHGARWCMIQVGDDWHFAINHDDLAEPIDLTNFNVKRIKRQLSQKWQRLLDPAKPTR
jgi:hypothetical protein